MIEFQVNKTNPSESKFVEKQMPTKESLEEGQVLLKVEHFAFTSNNITYAVIGEQIGYWQFFPATEGYGIIPAWGFAEVAISNCEGVQEGERFYGYYPMGSHLVVQPAKVKETGFVDGSTHRQALPPIYNYYTNTKKDLLYASDKEALLSLFRPLFTTSFLINEVVNDNDAFGAKQIILTSASSKTAMALAFLLAERKKNQGADFQVIGLTSPSNEEFVKSRDWYDQVLTYDSVSNISTADKSVIVDFSGNHSLQYNLQTHLGDQLAYNCLVGLVHWDQMRGAEKLPKQGTFFFAPDHAQKRNNDDFRIRLGTAWHQFIGGAGDWLAISNQSGKDALKKTYLETLSGKINPKQGVMISI